jgi:uncharacterized protein (TIGR00369 family)
METRKSLSDYAQLLGVERIEPGEGTVRLTLPTGTEHANRGGWVHGGVLAGLLDMALGGAVVTTLAEGEWTATMSLTTDFLRPAKPGTTLVAQARVDRRGRLAAYPSGEVVDESGEVLARATGVWAVRSG